MNWTVQKSFNKLQELTGRGEEIPWEMTGAAWLQVPAVGGRGDGAGWGSAVEELIVGSPVGTNIIFRPPTTLRSKHQDLHNPHAAQHLLHQK